VTFLHAFAQIILQVIAVCESDAENRAECFVYVCEQLARHRFGRLRRFQREGPASFTTWLRAVVRNLCVDWRRREFGRHTTFVATHPTSPLDREVSARLFRPDMSDNEIVDDLCTPPSDVSQGEVESSFDRVSSQTAPGQACVRRARSIQTESMEGENGIASRVQVADPAPTPETIAELCESKRALRRGLRSLPFEQRLAISFRFEQDLTLEEIATLLQLKNAQAADRVLRNALAQLREAVDPSSPFRGKTKLESV
jgi:RNA polymerase sigma factor (sigma-70 family)